MARKSTPRSRSAKPAQRDLEDLSWLDNPPEDFEVFEPPGRSGPDIDYWAQHSEGAILYGRLIGLRENKQPRDSRHYRAWYLFDRCAIRDLVLVRAEHIRAEQENTEFTLDSVLAVSALKALDRLASVPYGSRVYLRWDELVDNGSRSYWSITVAVSASPEASDDDVPF